MDYLLGANNAQFSYMVGFGSQYPLQVHHCSASIPSLRLLPTPVGCSQGFVEWFSNPNPNPNVFVGAIVGGPTSVSSIFLLCHEFQFAVEIYRTSLVFIHSKMIHSSTADQTSMRKSQQRTSMLLQLECW